MSHVVDANIVIKDLPAFKEACKACGMVFKENQKEYKWYGSWVNDYAKEDAAYLRAGVKPEDYGKCVHAAAVAESEDAYELGLVKNPRGEGFVLIFDFYGSQGEKLQTQIGKAGAKLKTEYGLAVLTRKAKVKGYKVARVTRRKNGQIKDIELEKRR